MKKNNEVNALSPGLSAYFYPHEHSEADRKRRDVFLSEIFPGHLLDAGCGRGNISLAAWKAGNQVTAVDLSKSSLRESRFLFERENADIRLIEASLCKLPFEDSSFDSAICGDVMEHIPDAPGAVRELYRVLKPPGKLVISVPNAETFGFFYDHLVTKLISEKKQTPFAYKRYFKLTDEEIRRFDWNNKEIIGHCQDFTLPAFRHLLTSGGFEIRKIHNWRFLYCYFRSAFTALGLGPLRWLERMDLAMAPLVPHRLAADWIVVCQKPGGNA